MLSKMLSRIHRDEEGVAIITAVISSMIVVILGTSVVQLALHSGDASARDRHRVQAIGAAESGLDYYMSFLTATGGQELPCPPNPILKRTMVGSPGRFEISPIFYWGNGTQFGCPAGTPAPEAVLIRSTGYSGPAGREVKRTMEAYAKLTVSSGATFDNSGAIISQSAVNFNSNATIGGSNFSDADVYTNGTVTLASNSTLYGNILAQGGVTMGSNAEVKKDVWAKGSVSMLSGATVRGSVTASQAVPTPSNITMAGNARVYGDAKAGGTITGGQVSGTQSGGQLTLSPPPSRAYPSFTFNQADWTNAGFTNYQPFTDCGLAESYIRNSWTSGALLVRVSSTCDLTFGNNPYTVRGNLAIIANGPITFQTGARFSPASGTTANVFLIGGLSGTAPCDITMNTNSGFGPGLPTLIYTPQACAANLTSNTALTEGQILAGTVNFKHTAQFSYKRLTVPGTGTGGFKQDLFYKREIIG